MTRRQPRRIAATLGAILIAVGGLSGCSLLGSPIGEGEETEPAAGEAEQAGTEDGSPGAEDPGETGPATTSADDAGSGGAAEPDPASADPAGGDDDAPDGDGAAGDGWSEEPPLTDRPDDLPSEFPDIGVPFYQPAELVANPSQGEVWVLEYVTGDDLADVVTAIEGALSEDHGWSNLSADDQNGGTVFQAAKDGYSLVIAVLPEHTDASKVSLHYTFTQD